MKNQLFYPMALALAGMFLISSCSTDDEAQITEGNSQTKLYATASEGSSANNNARIIVNGMSSTEFTIGTSDLELRYAAEADIKSGISLGNLTLKTNVNSSLQASSSQAKSLTIMSNGESKLDMVAEGETPKGNYAEAIFQLKKNTSVSTSDPKYNKSIWITGTVENKQTVIWSETEQSIRAATESSNGVEVSEQSELVLEFDMTELFANVDFTTATDTNGNGKIEIGPGNVDGNSQIYTRIESNIQSAVKLRSR